VQKNSGQSLIEVSFATAIVSLVLVAILSTVIQSVQNSRVSLEQTRATQYSQEALEWARSQRDLSGWGVFSSSISTVGPNITFCVSAVPEDLETLLAQPVGDCDDETFIGETQFQRHVIFDVLSPTQIQVTAEVTRPGKTGVITTTLETILADYE
jgi:type II secretory pathway pseudopilin PulG